MKQRTFVKLNREVGEVGLGCWQFGGGFGPMDKDTAWSILDAAIRRGVDFLDTADVYGAGQSETWIGEYFAQRGRPDGLTIATKLGRGALFADGFSFEKLREKCEGSRQRLQVDTLDLTQLHCVPTEVLREGKVFGWLDTLVAEGGVRAWGASVESIEEAMICLDQPGLASLQMIFNVFRPKPAEEVFARAQAQGVSIIVRLPLASGMLAGKYTPQTTFDASDHRHYNRDGERFNVGETFAGLPFDKGLEAVEAVRPLVPEGTPMAQFALRWILDHDAVTVIIPGASKVAQIESNADASGLDPLPESTHQRLAEIDRQQVRPHIRGPY